MRKSLKTLFCALIALCFAANVFCACANPADGDENGGQPAAPMQWKEDGELKILAIGNSFSIDSLEYVYQIAESLGVEKIKLGNLYIGGCTLDMHISNAKAEEQGGEGQYGYFYNIDGVWNVKPNGSLIEAITSDNWDFITLQQQSLQSGYADTFGALDELVAFVQKYAGEKTKLAWNMTWAYRSDFMAQYKDFGGLQEGMYKAVTQTAQQVILPRKDFEIIMPTGTAIQNARTTYLGDTSMISRDGTHLNLTWGRYIAGLTWVRSLTGLSIHDIKYAPEGISDYGRALCIECAENAVKMPFAVTQSQFTEIG